MKEYQTWLPEFMSRLSFPTQAQDVFIDALARLADNKDFLEILKRYEQDELCPYNEMLQSATTLGSAVGLHEYTTGLLMYLCLAKTLHKRYVTRDIDEQIFWDSMMDLRYKLEECRLVKGKVGSFVCAWFPGFFKLTRFALGRLQFDLTTLKEDITVNGTTLPKGTAALGVHIPRTESPLDHTQVEKSYAMAAGFFAKEFAGKPLIFICSSWLLDPWLPTVLSPQSNIAAFHKDFTIVKTGKYENYKELWRLFDCEVTDDPASLPQDSSLRRAYVARMQKGEPIGWGYGIILY